MKKIIIVSLLVLVTNIGFSYPMIPNSKYTIGHKCSVGDSDFESYNYSPPIPYCKRNVSSSLKQKIYIMYGIPLKETKQYTIDHYYPLSIGGSNHITNLWPEHKSGVKSLRENFEIEVFKMLKDEEITQENAFKSVDEVKQNPGIDWQSVLNKYRGKK